MGAWILIASVLVLIGLIGVSLWWKKRNRISITAQVLRKDATTYQHAGRYGTTTKSDYVVVFLVEEKTLSFVLRSFWQYDSIHEGDTGILTYSGRTFYDFESFNAPQEDDEDYGESDCEEFPDV